MLAAATLVADLTTVVPALGISVTSRAPLHVRGEREYALSALALGPESETLPPKFLAGARQCNSSSIGSATCNPTFSSLRRTHRSWPPSPLYYMLETLRAYAGVELAAARERDDAMEGLVRYCTAEAALAAVGLIGPTQLEWLDRVREDLDSYRAALGWLIERGRAAEASGIAWALLFFWLIRGHATEGLRGMNRY